VEKTRAETLAELEGLRQIPALQSLAKGFVQAANRADVSVDVVIDAISKDPALCVRVLRMANSAMVSPAERIEDLGQAVQMLGVLRVRTMEQALFTLRDARSVVGGLDWRHIWIHSFATAALVDEIDRSLGTGLGEQIYLAALLHDVGKMVLATIAPDAYRQVLVSAWNDQGSLEDLERRVLGVDHREAGGIFARQNQLPPCVIAAVCHHNDPAFAESFRLETALVAVSNFISKSHGLGFSGARLNPGDDVEGLPAWAVMEERLGRPIQAAALLEQLSPFIGELRIDLKGLHAA